MKIKLFINRWREVYNGDNYSYCILPYSNTRDYYYLLMFFLLLVDSSLSSLCSSFRWSTGLCKFYFDHIHQSHFILREMSFCMMVTHSVISQ